MITPVDFRDRYGSRVEMNSGMIARVVPSRRSMELSRSAERKLKEAGFDFKKEKPKER